MLQQLKLTQKQCIDICHGCEVMSTQLKAMEDYREIGEEIDKVLSQKHKQNFFYSKRYKKKK